jgi:hypothetical protein
VYQLQFSPTPIPDVMAQHDHGQTGSGLKPVPPLRLAGFEVPARLGNRWPTEPVLDELTAREHEVRSDCPRMRQC